MMIPAGPERDKRIAELRGELCHHPYIDDKPFDCMGDPVTVENCTDADMGLCEFYRIKLYSTDIATAMELWQEMLTSGRVGFDRWRGNVWKYDGGYRARIENVWTGIETITHSKHPTLIEAQADAISGCWLKWKEGGKG